MDRKRSWRMPDSIFLRVSVFMTFSMVAIAGILVAKSFSIAESAGTSAINSTGTELTGLLASQVGGSVRFRKTEDIDRVLLDSFERLNGKIRGGVAMSNEGEILSGDTASIENLDQLEALGRQAIETGRPAADPSALIFANPVVFGSSDTPIGAVVIQWDTDSMRERIVQQKTETLIMVGVIFLVIIAIMGFALRRIISVPLSRIAHAMKEVSLGNYDVAIPKSRRGSEIGVVTTTLEQFRDQLKSSEEASRIAAFTGAGFAGSSAALMITDENLTVIYTNTAFDRLARQNASDFKVQMSSFDPDNIVGQTIDAFHPELRRKQSTLKDTSSTVDLDAEFGALTISLAISPIDDADQQRTGYILEWEDVTISRQNAAIIDSLDKNQAKAEFHADGRLVAANDAFLVLAGISDVGEAAGMKDLVTSAKTAGNVNGTTAQFGDFEIRSATGSPAVLHGGLSPIFNKAGTHVKSVLIGANITEERRQKRLAEEESARLVADQTQMIDALRGALEHLSNGDLTLKIETPFAGENDQLRNDFNAAVAGLHDAISAVSTRAAMIRGEVDDISGAADDLSRRTEHQAATLEETAAALTEITASVSSAAEGARRANEVVSEARKNAEESGGVVQDAVSAMGEIAESSKQISSIISVIDDIAFQTNLLALNAGVEAARAGDAGRGFAVVASEVRALAQRSSDAAREINALISESGDHVTRGVTLVGDAGSALEEIVSSVGNISEHVSDIAASAQEQSGGLAEINAAMSQLDQVTQQNAAMFEETTAASQTLTSAAAELTTAVSRFRVSGVNPPPSSEYSATVPSEDVQTAPRLKATGTHGLSEPAAEDDLDDDWKDF